MCTYCYRYQQITRQEAYKTYEDVYIDYKTEFFSLTFTQI